MSSDNPQPLPRAHYPTPWSVHTVRRGGELVEVRLEDARRNLIMVEVRGDTSLEPVLVSYDRTMRCVNACELLKTDHPDREIEALQRDRARLMDILAGRGFKRPRDPDITIHPGSDEPCEHQSILEGVESKHVETEDGKLQIGPVDV